MTNQKPMWTKEPWECESNRIIITSDENDGGNIICLRPLEGTQPKSFSHWASNSERIIQCVNTLAGIPDPAEFVRAAKEALSLLKALKESLEIEGVEGLGQHTNSIYETITRLSKALGADVGEGGE